MLNKKCLKKSFTLLAILLSVFHFNLLKAHSEEYEDSDRYHFVFNDYSSIKKFIGAADAFSEKHRHSFMKQKMRDHGDFYILEIRDDVFRIECSNIGSSVEMHCRESRLKGIEDELIKIEKWDFKKYLQSQGFEARRS